LGLWFVGDIIGRGSGVVMRLCGVGVGVGKTMSGWFMLLGADGIISDVRESLDVFWQGR